MMFLYAEDRGYNIGEIRTISFNTIGKLFIQLTE